MEILLIYLAVGTAAGLLAGLFGVGGGLLIVPALALTFTALGMEASIIMHLALGTSLATIVVTSLSSVRAHHRNGNVPWPVVLAMAPAIAAGALGGAIIAHWLPSLWLQRGFGAFALLVAVQMWIGFRPSPTRQVPGKPALAAAGGGIGIVSALAGIGGGTLTVPFLTWRSVAVHRAIGAAAACGLPIAIGGTIGYILAGWHVEVRPAWTTGYVYWPAFAGIATATVLFAPAGAWIGHRLPAHILRRLFAILLAVLGLRMIF